MEIVIISEYDPGWSKEFEQEKVKIMNCLEKIVIGIEHIGSTSVPGLAAKPLIDIMAGVPDLSDLTESHIQRLNSIGYEFVDHAHFPERRFFRRGAWRDGTHHLHVYQHQGEHWNANLRFRNYLRRHPEAVKQYSELKKLLAEQHKHDRAAYTKAKAPFIQRVMQQAESEEL